MFILRKTKRIAKKHLKIEIEVLWLHDYGNKKFYTCIELLLCASYNPPLPHFAIVDVLSAAESAEISFSAKVFISVEIFHSFFAYQKKV